MIELKSVGIIKTRKNTTIKTTKDDFPIILFSRKEYCLCFCYYEIGIVLKRKENIAEVVKRIIMHRTVYSKSYLLDT